MMNNISLRHWRSFEAAAAFGSFSRAAEALEITQPAVSMQLRQLEEAVGTGLFDKQARPMQLTPSGQALLRHARAILSEVRIAEDAVAALATGRKGLLHLGMVTPANYFAPQLIQLLRRRYPELQLDVRIDKRDVLLAQLAEYRLDLAITGYPPAEADVDATTFAHHPHLLVAAADHPLASTPQVEWAQLAHEPIVLRERGSATRQFMEHLLQARSLRPPIAAELQGSETVKQAVMAGLGLTLISAHAIQVELEAGRLAVLRLPEMPKRLDWCILHRRDRALTPEARTLRDLLVAEGSILTACRID